MYSKDQNGIFHVMTPAGRETIGRSVAILFDAKTGTLLKHGAPRDVQATHSFMQATPLANDIVLFENARWSPDFLDRLVNTSGLVGQWWKKQVTEKGALDRAGLPRA